jgi:Tol biopolymer transport system component
MCAGEAGRSVAGMTRIALLTGAVCLAVAAPATAEPVNGRIAFSTFESGPAQGTGDIWTMNPDGGGRLQAVFDPLDDAQSDWAPNGNKIVFRNRRNNRFQVAIIDFSVRDAATGRPRVTDVPAAADGTQSSQPAWFPDGSQRLLYRRTNAPVTTASDIWAMNTDGSDRRPIAVLPNEQFYPSFSPDMSKLLYATVDQPGGRSIHVMDMATGVDTTLFDHTPASFDSAPAWSPDAKKIAFESNMDGDMEIYVMNADGSGVQQITRNTHWDEGPAWSPDGTKFAFSTGADDAHLDIWTMNVDGSNQQQLTTFPGRDESPDWGVNPGPASVGGTVPATLSLRLGEAVSLGTFEPGVARDYTATSTATVTSTAGDATLSVLDTSGVSPGRLVNGTLALPQPLQVRADDGAYAPIPSDLLRYDAPVSNDPVTIGFKQPIAATDALRTGNYAKTLTFTLSTTRP